MVLIKCIKIELRKASIGAGAIASIRTFYRRGPTLPIGYKMENPILPGDLMELPDGSNAVVNSAHYFCYKTNPQRQMFSICPPGGDGPYPGPLYYADECKLIHRHEYKPYKGIRKCDCGDIYTTMADMIEPHSSVTRQ